MALCSLVAKLKICRQMALWSLASKLKICQQMALLFSFLELILYGFVLLQVCCIHVDNFYQFCNKHRFLNYFLS